MNLLASAPTWLAWALAALLVAAAIEDSVRQRISNILSLGVFAGALVAIGLGGLEAALWQNALVFALLLAGGTLLFGAGKMGGGDVKLLAAAGLWCNLEAALALVPIVFIAGGLLALVILGARMLAPDGAARRVAVLRPGSGIPYGIAIAAGTLIAMALARA
ncbi:MAG TPA: prepilin peptidase [Sphingomicrobium sp.]|nr:prepilin peptidase [Sphingomicrobium sp.]